MCATLLQGSFDKIKIAKNQLTRVSAQGIESVNRPVDLGFPKACSMIVWIPCHDTISIWGISIMWHVPFPRSGLESAIHIPASIGALSSTMGVQAGKQRIGWWHVMQIINLTAFYMKGLSTTSACYKMSDLENFVAASGAASRHTAMMWWDVVTEANKMLCNISRRILSYQKKLSKMSIFEEIQVLERQKYRPRSLAACSTM